MSEKHGVVVLLEGSEQCGKTVLSDKIHNRFKADYLHGDRPLRNGFEDFHRNMTVAAFEMAVDGHVVVLDRCFISHQVYGELFDGGTQYDTHKLCEEFNSALEENGAKLIIVYCRPDREFDPDMREEMYDDSDGRIQSKFDELIDTYQAEVVKYNWKKDPSGETILNLIEEVHNGR